VNFKANISQEQLIEEFKKFIPNNYEFILEGGKYVLIGGENEQKLENKVEVLFDRDIKPALIKELQEAKFLIWIVMYQFTDVDLFKEVLKKHKEGANIQIITSDQNAKFNFKQYGIEHYTVSTIHYTDIFKKTMHDKICIIDLERTISGSYNWTYPAANENYETVTPISSIEVAKQFATKFMALKIRVINDAKLSK
jgi:phosphatidylserine/phosphatidylglycerophosphate/cardiolipin synthase-like enzyme